MPQTGLLVQIDGTSHDWLEGRGPRLVDIDLHVADQTRLAESADDNLLA